MTELTPNRRTERASSTVQFRSTPSTRLARARAGAFAVSVLLVLGISACGSATQRQTAAATAIARRPVVPRHRTPHRPAAVSRAPGMGAAQAVHASDTTLVVTLSRVIDPLSGSGAALLAGTRAVGVSVRIQNRGPGIYDSSATGDISLAPSAGTAMPVFAPHGVCQTPLRDFDNYISPGEVREGCVVFAVPSAAKVLAVRFSPHGQTAGRASWRDSH